MGKAAVLLILFAAAGLAAVKIEKTDYHGWKNTYRISNGTVELLVVTDVGPRIMRYSFIGGPNMFKESENQLGKSGETTWQGRGGHRFWVAPEKIPDTYAPDNTRVEAEVQGGALVVTGNIEKETGLQKVLTIQMEPAGTGVTILHEVVNRAAKARVLAPWGVTQMAQGGVGILGFPPRQSHRERLTPTNSLTMWGYTDFTDPRWKILRKYLILRQDPNARSAQKAGLFNPASFAAYLLGDNLFVKKTVADPAKTYPDLGATVEAYTDAGIEELETLGALVNLEPGAKTGHVERWSLFGGVKISEWTDEGLDGTIGSMVR